MSGLHVRRWGAWGLLLIIMGMAALLFAPPVAYGESVTGAVEEVELPDTPPRLWGRPGPVWLLPVHGTIDEGLAHFVERVVRQAEEADVGLLLVEIDTFGGRVDAATEIRDALLRTSIPTAVYIPNRAISAGALIALTGQQIVMELGASVGAAEPIPNDPKTVAYVRGEFEATAERMGRDPQVAAAMVDQSVVVERIIDGASVRLVSEGQILSLSAREALAIGFIDHIADDRADALALLGYEGREIVEVEMSVAERFLRFITEPTVAQILLTLGFLALMAELSTPGLGLPGAVGVIALSLFFGSRYLVGILDEWQIVLFVVGLLLLLVEIFVIPGFGIAGVLGIGALGTSIWYSFADSAAALRALAITAVVLIGGLILLYRSLDRIARWRHIILKTDMGGEAYAPVAVAERRKLLGKVGTTTTVFRPAGTVEIDGEPYDAVSEGAYIQEGARVRVVKVEGTRIVVRPRKDDPDASTDE